MDRYTSHLRVLLQLAPIILAVAVLVGGCAAAEYAEKSAFGAARGHVVNQAGDPIQGAQVTVVSATNYFGDAGPFVTDATGTFRIPGLQVSTTNPVTIKLQASAPGYASAPVLRTTASGTTDTILVDRQSITELLAVLPPAP